MHEINMLKMKLTICTKKTIPIAKCSKIIHNPKPDLLTVTDVQPILANYDYYIIYTGLKSQKFNK